MLLWELLSGKRFRNKGKNLEQLQQQPQQEPLQDRLRVAPKLADRLIVDFRLKNNVSGSWGHSRRRRREDSRFGGTKRLK